MLWDIKKDQKFKAIILQFSNCNSYGTVWELLPPAGRDSLPAGEKTSAMHVANWKGKLVVECFIILESNSRDHSYF